MLNLLLRSDPHATWTQWGVDFYKSLLQNQTDDIYIGKNDSEWSKNNILTKSY